MSKEMKNKVWSEDDENFNYESIGELLEQGFNDLEPGCTVSFADKDEVETKQLVSIHWILEEIQERAYDIGGDRAEGLFYGVEDRAKRDLQDMIVKWLDDNVGISFYGVKNVEEYVLTEQDFIETDRDY